MNQKTISYEKALNFGFSSFINNIFTFFLLWVSSFVLFIGGWVLILVTGLLAAAGFIVIPILLGIALMTFLVFFYHYQMIRFSLAIYEGKPLPWTQFFAFSWSSFMPYCIARTIRRFLILLGGFLLIIPAIYWSCKYYFAGYSLIDLTNESISQDREYARKLSQGIKWQILGFALLLYVLLLIFSLTLMFAFPIIYLANVHVYKQLEEQTAAEERSIQVESYQRT